ncbi:MAG: ABC transporter ATP-binding protein [Desulfobacteraceae bacterium]|jgi:ABC-type branched-subunit amino acid transport system ATPase component
MMLLSVRSLTKRFGGLTALKSFDIEVESGEIVGIIGPNGSGKTTFFNVLTGMHKADKGEIYLEGAGGNLLEMKTHKIIYRGIARTFQNQRPFNNLSVLENLMVGGHCQTRGGILSALFNLPGPRRDREWLKERANEVMRIFGDRLISMKDSPAWTLSYANRRRLEIARALMSKPKLLLLDEPTAGMNPAESLQLIKNILNINREGITIFVIEHDMNFIKNLCRRIVALDYGMKIVEGTFAEVRNHPKVIEAYLGRD